MHSLKKQLLGIQILECRSQVLSLLGELSYMHSIRKKHEENTVVTATVSVYIYVSTIEVWWYMQSDEQSFIVYSIQLLLFSTHWNALLNTVLTTMVQGTSQF